MKNITLLSPAKINLTFEILSKRNDGYHDIRSIMQPVNLFDKVIVEVDDGRGINLICRGIKISDDSSNLAYRAAELYLSSGNVEEQVTITLYKSIPLGSGLGGGGFMMVWRPGMRRPAVLDFRESAPKAATRTMCTARTRAWRRSNRQGHCGRRADSHD